MSYYWLKVKPRPFPQVVVTSVFCVCVCVCVCVRECVCCRYKINRFQYLCKQVNKTDGKECAAPSFNFTALAGQNGEAPFLPALPSLNIGPVGGGVSQVEFVLRHFVTQSRR